MIDLGAIDLYRDRERGVPRYNQLRRELGLNPLRTLRRPHRRPGVRGRRCARCTADASGATTSTTWTCWSARSREGHRPTGFGFGETLFQIFILNASLRLLADRFFTDDYRAEVYTPEGLAWIDDTTIQGRAAAPLPGLADTGLANVDNAFEPWDFGRLDPARHPLRAWDKKRDDPWAGDAPGLG